MNGGNFSEAAPYATLYDPQPVAPGWQGKVNTTLCPNPNAASSYTNGYLNYQCRPSFTAEYGETGAGVNTIPASRIALAAGIMMQDLAAISALVGTPAAGEPASYSSFWLNDYLGKATIAYSRNASDTKITYIPNENTQIFGKFGITPYSDIDPQVLGDVPCTGSGATPARADPPQMAASRAMWAAAVRTPAWA